MNRCNKPLDAGVVKQWLVLFESGNYESNAITRYTGTVRDEFCVASGLRDFQLGVALPPNEWRPGALAFEVLEQVNEIRLGVRQPGCIREV